jgi:hypothetical protein
MSGTSRLGTDASDVGNDRITDFTRSEDGLRFDTLSDVDRVVQTLTMNGLLISISEPSRFGTVLLEGVTGLLTPQSQGSAGVLDSLTEPAWRDFSSISYPARELLTLPCRAVSGRP